MFQTVSEDNSNVKTEVLLWKSKMEKGSTARKLPGGNCFCAAAGLQDDTRTVKFGVSAVWHWYSVFHKTIKPTQRRKLCSSASLPVAPEDDSSVIAK